MASIERADGHGWQCRSHGVGCGRCPMPPRAPGPGPRLIVALALAIVALGLPSPSVSAVACRLAGRRRRHRRRGRESLERAPDGDLRRAAEAQLGGPSHQRPRHAVDHEYVRRTDRPRRTQHDRRTARGDPARPGHRRWRRGQGEGERPDDRRAARRRPSGRRLDDDPRPVPGHAADEPRRLELAVHEGERHRRSLPLAAVGQPQDPVQPAEPRRPFVTPSSPFVRVTIVTTRKLDLATSGGRVSNERGRPDQGLRGAERPRLHGHRGS